MDYEVVNIVDNVLYLSDTKAEDEWGNPTMLAFTMDDASPFKVGDKVQITIVKRALIN